nr:MAG TPA: chlorophyll a/b-binding protein-like protein [Caudoviricetes sp.]
MFFDPLGLPNDTPSFRKIYIFNWRIREKCGINLVKI